MYFKTKCYRTRTFNENGKFEVEFEEHSFWRKLFGRPYKFKYCTSSVEIKHDKYLSDDVGLYYDWFDKDDNLITDTKTLDKISYVINSFKKERF